MPETPQANTPDLEYAKQLRVGWVDTKGGQPREYRTPLDMEHIAASNGELTDGVRGQLDRIVSSVDSVNQHAHSLPGYTEAHIDALQSGYVLAGENATGGANKTEMRFASAEEFRVMVARSVGEAALAAYEGELRVLQQPAESRLISTVGRQTGTDPSGSARPKLISTFDSRPEQAQVPGEVSGDALRDSDGGDIEPSPWLAAVQETTPAQREGTVFEEPSDAVAEATGDSTSVQEAVTDPEVQAEESSQEVVESIPEEPEATETENGAEAEKTVTLAEVMSSPDAMVRALHDDELNPDVKNQLRQVVGAWNNLKLAKASDQVWNEIVKPQLDKLDAPLEGIARRAHQASDELEALVGGLRQLATAVEYGDYERMGSLGRRHRFAESFEEVLRSLNPVLTENSVGAQARRLDIEMLEADEGLRRMRRGASTEEFGVDDAEQLLTAIEVHEGMSVTDIRQEIERQDTSNAVRKLSTRKETVEAVIQFARTADRNQLMQDYVTVRRVVMSQVEQVFAQGSRMNAGEVHQLRGYIERKLLGPLQQIERFTRLGAMYQKEATR